MGSQKISGDIATTNHVIMNERLAKKVSGFGDRRRSQMISRLHMLCHPLESGPRSISIEDSRVNFIIGGEVGTSYSLLVVDEVSKNNSVQSSCLFCFFFSHPLFNSKRNNIIGAPLVPRRSNSRTD